MNTKQLRQKILDLAIRGKLVPQDPNDESASALVEKIRAEKERLIKEKKIKRDKNESFIFRGEDKSHYEKSITDVPFEIPENWEWCRLGDIGEIVTGNTPLKERKDFYGDEYPFYKPTDLGKGLFVDKASDNLSSLGYANARQLPAFSVLVTCIGATIGKTGLILKNGTCNQQINAIIPHSSIEYKFLYFCCITDFLQTQIKENASATTLPIINKSKFEQLVITLPPIAEQHRIVSEIERLFSIIDIIEDNKLSLAQIIKQAKSKVLDLAIHGKLVPQDPNDEPASVLLERIKAEQKTKKQTADNSHYPFEVPESWTWCRLNDIANIALGKTLDKQKNKGEFKTYLRSVNIRWGHIDLDDLKEMKFEESELEKYNILERDLLICEGGEAGRCAVWKNQSVSVRYQNAIHRVRFYAKINSDFYMYALWHYNNSEILEEYCKGVTIKHLTGQALNLLYFPLPPLAEQKRIVNQIETIFNQLDAIEQSIKA
ncbi:hypothetical protein AGMMS50262_01440 [Bacteroidia bacterium]|nr:hypothetical protein AGMMS50262_01440 [Bacteroidia bacterium]